MTSPATSGPLAGATLEQETAQAVRAYAAGTPEEVTPSTGLRANTDRE